MSLLRTRPATTPEMLAIFGDHAVITHALAFEAALAEASAAEGLIHDDIAKAIVAACHPAGIDASDLADRAALAGTLAIPLVATLRERLDRNAGPALHRGATSQDLADTVLMRQAAAAAAAIRSDIVRMVDALDLLAREYADTPAIGRTLLQDARPVAFGLRIAQWHAAIVDAAIGFDRAIRAHVAIQLGGPVGSRAGFDGRGEAVMQRMAGILSLSPAQPWHARRNGIAAIGASLGLLIGALGGVARDVALLAQNAVGEAREPQVEGRGGSSAMAHKRNPTGCQVALSAAIRAPTLVATLLAAMPAELERGIGGWQADAPVLADLFMLAAGAARAMADIATGLEVDRDAIARNLAAADQGEDLGESAEIIAALLSTAYPE